MLSTDLRGRVYPRLPGTSLEGVAFDVPGVVGAEGWTSASALTAQLNRNTVSAWTTTGKLVRLEKGIYAEGGVAADWRIRVEAAVRSRNGVASHSTALALWGLLPPPPGPVHVTVATGRSGRGSAGVVLHRSKDIHDAVRRVRGLPVTYVERSLVDSWGRPGGLERTAVRAAAIDAFRQRMCTTRNLLWEIERRPQLPGRAALLELVRLLAEGCRSELEIWGCLHILRGPGMPRFIQQRRVVVGGERFILDAACEESMLAVEMDGAAWHGSRGQRERDIRRDAPRRDCGLADAARRLHADDHLSRRLPPGHPRDPEARLRMLRGG